MKKIILFAWLFCSAGVLAAQADSAAFRILDQALGIFAGGQDIGLEFSAVKFGSADKYSALKDKDAYAGAHLYMSGNKYELDLGMVKAISDGVLTVYIDDLEGTMIVDSLKDVLASESTAFDFLDEVAEGPYQGKLVQAGKEKINGTDCHVLKMVHSDAKISWFWISVQDNRLVMLTEEHDGVFDSYLVKRLGTAPKEYNYGIELPASPLQTLYGYEVIDNRYYKN